MSLETDHITQGELPDILFLNIGFASVSVHPVTEPFCVNNRVYKRVTQVTLGPEIFSLSEDDLDSLRTVFKALREEIEAYFEICVYVDPGPDHWKNYSDVVLEGLLQFPLNWDERDMVWERIPWHTYIYLIQDKETGLTKIGRSEDPQKRLKQLKYPGTLMPRPLDFFIYHSWADDPRVEKELHSKFKEQRVRGEWFNLSKDDLVKIGKGGWR